MMIKLFVSIAWCVLLGWCATPSVDPVIVEEAVVQEEVEKNTIWPTLCNGPQCIAIEIADTPDTRTQWLMFRTEMGEDNGMLFIFNKEEIYAFWMKNTLIPLDMVWIDSNNTIVDIQTAVPCEADPCPTYKPSWESLYVLEINAKRANELWWKPGDQVTIKR